MPHLALTGAHTAILARMAHYPRIEMPKADIYDATDKDASTAFRQLVDGGYVAYGDDHTGRYCLTPLAYSALYDTEAE
jgi:DNA-binding IclR family transcriptional regulator